MDTIFNPTKVIAVGLNYTDHAKELKMTLPEHPLLFMKPPPLPSSETATPSSSRPRPGNSTTKAN